MHSVMFPSLDSMEMLLQKIWIDTNYYRRRKCQDRFNVHFARMGEPTWNDQHLDLLSEVWLSLQAKTVHPATMLPKANNKLGNFLQVWCSIKNEFYNGEAGLQFSINSTDREMSCLTLRVCHQHKFLGWLTSYQCRQAESIL